MIVVAAVVVVAVVAAMMMSIVASILSAAFLMGLRVLVRSGPRASLWHMVYDVRVWFLNSGFAFCLDGRGNVARSFMDMLKKASLELHPTCRARRSYPDSPTRTSACWKVLLDLLWRPEGREIK